MSPGEVGPKGMPEQSNDYRVAIFGSGGVGKSSIVQRFVNGTFSENYVPTVEDTYRQVISCNKQQNVCTLHITDTTGSHQFPAMQRLSISRGHAFILVYAVDKAETFLHLDPIFAEIQQIKGSSIDDTPIVLVGNKKDESNRKVGTNHGEAKSKKWGIGFIESSAKNNENITELFEQLLSLEKRRNLSLSTEEDLKGKKGKKKAKSKSPAPTPESSTPKQGKKNESAEKKAAAKAAAEKSASGSGEDGPSSDSSKSKCDLM